MRSVFALPIALVLLTGGAWAKDTTIATTLTGVHQLCGANSTNCTGVTCGNTTCDASCKKGHGCTVTIHRRRTTAKPIRTPQQCLRACSRLKGTTPDFCVASCL
jgi:hypothetical protein